MVKYRDIKETTVGSDELLYKTDSEIRKCRIQKGFDTLVVYTLNYEYRSIVLIRKLLTEANAKIFRLGSTIARLKLKGINGELFTEEKHVVSCYLKRQI